MQFGAVHFLNLLNVLIITLLCVQRTTCIKAQKWPPTKLTHIVMNNSCVVPLTETGMEIGDRHYIWRQNGVKGYDP